MTMPYDPQRRIDLIDRFYAGTLTLGESRELRTYVDEDVRALEKRPGAVEKLIIAKLLLSALDARVQLMAAAES